MNDKRRHHYIWRYYLKPWSQNEQIFCLTRGKAFPTNLMNIGQQRDFYHFEELSDQDLDFIRNLILGKCEKNLKKLNEGWIEMFVMPFNYAKILRSQNTSQVLIDEFKNRLSSQLHEEFHSLLEADSTPHLKAIYLKDKSHFDNDKNKTSFFFFLCVQYFRTYRMKKNLSNSLKHIPGFNFERAWGIISIIFATNVSRGLYVESDVVFIENKSTVPFLTADQPVINLVATDHPADEPVKAIELYYPISPSQALLIKEKSKIESHFMEANEYMVQNFNRHMVKQALEQIYSSSKEQLEKLTTPA